MPIPHPELVEGRGWPREIEKSDRSGLALRGSGLCPSHLRVRPEPPSFVILDPSVVILGPSFVILGPSFVILGPSFVILGPSFVILGLEPRIQ